MIDKTFNYSDKYKFTESWFDPTIPIWAHVFTLYPNIKNVLEIGCYEGRSTVWLCENVLIHPQTRYTYTVIDTFSGSLEESGMKGTAKRLQIDNFIENNFRHNISFFDNVTFNIHKGTSQHILPSLEMNEEYDFIYVDASHRADDTFVDAYFAHRLLKKGGLLIFDDFMWKDPQNLHPNNSPQLGIEMFNVMYSDKYKVLFEGYQVGFIKL